MHQLLLTRTEREETYNVYAATFTSGAQLKFKSLREITEGVYPCSTLDPQELGLDEFRPQQLEVIQLSQVLARLSPKARIYVSAPTGSGKSVIALGYLKGFDPIKEPGLILTADRALQAQYEELGIPSITGKPNWPCLIEPVLASKAPCARGLLKPQQCEHYEICPYFSQRNQGWAADACVTNYHYALQAGGSLPHRHTIADEAHFLEPIIRGLQTITLEMRPPKEPAIATQYMPKVTENIRLIQEELSVHPEETELDKIAHNLLQEKLARHLRVVALHEQYGDLVRVIPDGNSGRRATFFSPLGGLSYLRHGLPILAMSATLCDPFLLEGIDAKCAKNTRERDVYYLEVPSTFPAKNRPVYPLNTVKLGKGMSDMDYRQLGWTIDQLLVRHNNVKGVIHTVSYDLARQIKQMSDYSGLMITHEPGERDQAIEQFKAAPPGRVLVTPAASTGVDLPYDYCRWQAIAKLPFPYLGDPMVKIRMEQFPELSSLDTAQTIVQMAGRGMRAADDTCETYILDANWKWFWGRNWQLFPQWFREAVKHLEVR